MAWLPDGRILVTERGGTVSIVRNGRLENDAIEGAPESAEIGQGGLMDISVHPDFVRNKLVYMTLSTGSSRANRTCLVRAKLEGDRLTDVTTIYQNPRDKPGGQHFGSRVLWLPDKTLLLSVGDGGNPPARLDGQLIRNFAQDPSYHFGKILRLTEEGRPAPGNPFAGDGPAAAYVYTLGHRNIQGLARDPRSGRVWASEHGARGGDEVNMIVRGANYGWPLATFSVEYAGPKISDKTSIKGMKDPIVVWTPCPAPSGLAFYTGDKYPGWKGDLFSGGLVGQDVRRIDLDDEGNVLGQERLTIGARVRDVRQGPDGYLYVLTDEVNGRLLRIEPARGR
jgi:glucose/arabinose dehydrogenase